MPSPSHDYHHLFKANWDFGFKYAMRAIESGNWPTQAEVDALRD